MNFDRFSKFSTKAFGIGIVLILLVVGLSGLSEENFTNLMSEAASAYAQQNYKQALDLLDKAARIETNNFSTYLERGGTYAKIGRYDKAESDFNTAIALATNNIPLSYVYLNRGYFYQQQTNYDKAVDDFSKAVQINPSFQMAYVYRADVYNLQRRFDLSIMDCNMAIMLDPDSMTAYCSKGIAFDGKQNYGRAIEAYTKAIMLDTNDAWTYGKRASDYSAMEDHTNAVQDFDKVIQLQPTWDWAYACRGLVKSRLGNFKGGIEDCEKAVLLDTNSYIGCNNLAWLLATAPKSNLRDGQKAVENARHACELTSWKEPYSLGTLAAAYAEIGNFTEAVKWESKCIVIGLPDKEMQQAHKELRLFEDNKPYHADK